MPTGLTSCPELNHFLRSMQAIASEGLDPKTAASRAVKANEELLASAFQLPEELEQVEPSAAYTRNLVYRDPGSQLAVIVIVWGPFQETGIHDHLNWGTVSVLEGKVHEINYELEESDDPARVRLAATDATLYEEGQIRSITPPPRSNIHKMGNPSWKRAVTLHSYGDPGTKSRVFDPLSGNVEVMELVFHSKVATKRV